MLNYTKGRIKVYDFDIKTEEKLVRKFMGLCPQHNLLFNDLTVYEHLILIGGVCFLYFRILSVLTKKIFSVERCIRRRCKKRS